MKLDPKVLESAVEIFSAKLGPCFHSVGSIDAKLIAAFKETLDTADLVPRQDQGLDLVRWEMVVKERDEARAQVAELTHELNQSVARHVVTKTKVAVLWKALGELIEYLDEHDWGLVPEGATSNRARAALTDTAEAAAPTATPDPEDG